MANFRLGEEGYDFAPELPSGNTPPLFRSGRSGSGRGQDHGRPISEPFAPSSVHSYSNHGSTGVALGLGIGQPRRGSVGSSSTASASSAAPTSAIVGTATPTGSGQLNRHNGAASVSSKATAGHMPFRVKFILADSASGSGGSGGGGEMRSVLVSRPLSWIDFCNKAQSTFQQLRDRPLPTLYYMRDSGGAPPYAIRNQDDISAMEASLPFDASCIRIQIALDPPPHSVYDPHGRPASKCRSNLSSSPRTYTRQPLVPTDLDRKPKLTKAISEPSRTVSSFEPTSDFHEYNSLQLPPMLVEEHLMQHIDLQGAASSNIRDDGPAPGTYGRAAPYHDTGPPPGSMLLPTGKFVRQESNSPSVFEGGGEFIPETDDAADQGSERHGQKKIYAVHPAHDHWVGEETGSVGAVARDVDNLSIGSEDILPRHASVTTGSPRLDRQLHAPPGVDLTVEHRTSPSKAEISVSPLTHSATGIDSLTSTTSSTSANSGERDHDSVHSLKVSADHNPEGGMPDRWKRGRQLGSGAFGTVYLCHDIDTGRELAVKQVDVGNLGSEMRKEVAILQAEIELLKKLLHDRIVSYVGVHSGGGILSIMMEYMAGGSIHAYLKENGPLTERLTRKYTLQVLEGLHYLHSQRIIHRDVKGANILRDLHGNVKLADFGASRSLQTIKSMSCLKSVHGTPYWMSPEVLNGNGYNETADIWSLGCTVIEMITGKPPWGDLEPMAALFRIGTCQSGPDLPQSVSVACTRFMEYTFQRTPERRASAAQLLKTEFIASLAATS
eukprot:scpid28808/ scgid8001/ Mitogen-activated protein kinase kinase kinase 2; MAPK/ERK kinase kinase 2